MECPYFTGVFMKYCVAEGEMYVPSIYDMREHCKHLQHRVCRRYLRSDSGSTTRNKASDCSDNARTIE